MLCNCNDVCMKYGIIKHQASAGVSPWKFKRKHNRKEIAIYSPSMGIFCTSALGKQKKIKREASTLTVDKVLAFWLKANIPMRERKHRISQVEKLFEEWRLSKKIVKRRSANHLAKQDQFNAPFDDLFDVAHKNALVLKTIPEDREFLLAQREKGRRGTMAGIDGKLTRKTKRKAERMLKHASRDQPEKIKFQERSTIVTIVFNSSSETAHDLSNQEASADEMASPYKQGRINVVTQTVSATLDKTKTSDRKATIIMAATAQSLGMTLKK